MRLPIRDRASMTWPEYHETLDMPDTIEREMCAVIAKSTPFVFRDVVEAYNSSGKSFDLVLEAIPVAIRTHRSLVYVVEMFKGARLFNNPRPEFDKSEQPELIRVIR